jgi:hypothetical protein
MHCDFKQLYIMCWDEFDLLGPSSGDRSRLISPESMVGKSLARICSSPKPVSEFALVKLRQSINYCLIPLPDAEAQGLWEDARG